MTSDSIVSPITEAADILKANGSPEKALRRLEAIGDDHPDIGEIQHLRGICYFRLGDAARATDMLLDAMRHGQRHRHFLLNLASVSARAGMPKAVLSALFDFLRGVDSESLLPFLPDLVRALGFTDADPSPAKDAVFEVLLAPLLKAMLARREMEVALRLEVIIYDFYVKATETEAHFGRCIEQIAPPFVEAGHYWREKLESLPKPALEPPYRVGFFIHNASTLAHIQILLTTLRGYRTLDDQPFEPIVYCFGGQSPEMEEVLTELGVRLVMIRQIHKESAGSIWQLLLRTREMIAEHGVQELVWISLVRMMPLAFAMRIAPVQVWWGMKYHNFSLDEIDGYVCARQTHGFGMLGGREWRMAMLGSDEWYDPGRKEPAAAIRASLDAEVVLMSLGRSEKMQDPAYVASVVKILQSHPDAIFLWAGRDEVRSVVEAFKTGGVLERTRFIGWVDTLLYSQVGDIFIDTFPFPCGVTLIQAMAAGKPVVLYDSPEAAQTGVWNVLKPRVEGDQGTPEERAELREIIGDRLSPNIAIARTPDEYIAYSGRLIDDAAARAAAGEASRRVIGLYYSDVKGMAATMSRHFVELIEERRAAS